MERKLHFSNEDTLYLLLNIMAHDVIHDYGPAGGSEKRWEDNQKIVKQFSSDFYTFSNPLVGGDEQALFDVYKPLLGDFKPSLDYQPSKKSRTTSDITEVSESPLVQTSIPKNIVVEQIPQKEEKNDIMEVEEPQQNIARGVQTVNTVTPQDKFTVDYENYINVLTEMKTDINNTIIFTFFNHYLLLNKSQAEIDFMTSDSYIVPLSYTPNYNYTDVFIDLSNKFIGYCYLNKVQTTLTYTVFLDILCKFLSSGVTTEAIFENIDFTQIQSFTQEQSTPQINSKKRKYMSGGKKDEELTYEEATELINKINELNESSNVKDYLNKLNDIYGVYNATQGEISQEQRKEYDETRNLLLKEYKKIFDDYNQTKKSGSLFGNIDILPILKARYIPRTVNLIEKFYGVIQNSILDYYKIIAEYQETQRKIEQKRLAALKAEEEEQRKLEQKRLADLRAEEQGELTSADKEVRENFATFIARSGLFLTNICSNTGVINSSYSSLAPNSALRKEINILLYISDWVKNTGWQEIRSQDLDSILINYFYETFPEIKGRYKCAGSNISNYVVNNAAPVEPALKELSFCPYTSILDGMSQCSWNSAQGNIEYGTMNFFITDDAEKIYYNGKLEIDTSSLSTGGYPKNIGLSFNVKVSPELTLNGKKNITINGSDLEAHFVLKNTLVNVINYILSVDDATRTTIFTGGNIFGNLFTIFSSNNNLQLFNKVYSEILFKGTGDLFQEINCVSKFGGYTMENYTINEGILSYKTATGDQLRLFAANDRPSGTRFIYMLLKGKPKEINIKAMGGYYSKENIFIVKRNDNTDNCKPVPVTKGGRKNNTRKMRKIRKVRKTRRLNTKSKRFSRKTRMIHRKSKKNYRKTRRH